MISDEEREQLHQFFGGYFHFHQDWAEEAPSVEAVIAGFASTHATRELDDLARGIRMFVDEHAEEHELTDALFRQLGCYYHPPDVGQSTRSWLLQVAAMLSPPV
jgi:hypothetical protein